MFETSPTDAPFTEDTANLTDNNAHAGTAMASMGIIIQAAANKHKTGARD